LTGGAPRPLFWSVERDGDTVVVNCPEPLRCAHALHPAWMGHCAGAIRDELRQLGVGEGTLLEATLAGDELPLGETLLYEVGIPQPHVGAGVRLARSPAAAAGVVQRYRHAPFAAAADEADATLIASVRVPLTDGHELDTAQAVWLATRDALHAALPPAAGASPAGVELRVRFVTGIARTQGSVELIRRLLDGVSASLYRHAGDAGSEPGPADDRIRVAEVTFVLGAAPQLEIELRALPGG
jgi:hypothetical protein